MNKFITVTRDDIVSIQWTREPYERAARAKECRTEKKVSISIDNIKYFYDNTILLYDQIYGLKEISVLETREEIESLIKQAG